MQINCKIKHVGIKHRNEHIKGTTTTVSTVSLPLALKIIAPAIMITKYATKEMNIFIIYFAKNIFFLPFLLVNTNLHPLFLSSHEEKIILHKRTNTGRITSINVLHKTINVYVSSDISM
jgi:hypothetical protein